jgi:hypothetical protein
MTRRRQGWRMLAHRGYDNREAAKCRRAVTRLLPRPIGNIKGSHYRKGDAGCRAAMVAIPGQRERTTDRIGTGPTRRPRAAFVSAPPTLLVAMATPVAIGRTILT